jgi:hypothetical protein
LVTSSPCTITSAGPKAVAGRTAGRTSLGVEPAFELVLRVSLSRRSGGGIIGRLVVLPVLRLHSWLARPLDHDVRQASQSLIPDTIHVYNE